MPANPTVLSDPWSLNPTPEILDDMVEEIVDVNAVLYKRLPKFSPHPNRTKYPGYLLVYETPAGQHESKRFWSNQCSNQDIYNYDIGYSGESNSHPIYSRKYFIRRDAYAAQGPLPKGTNMTGVWLIRLTNGGSGYNPEAGMAPTVTVSGGSGSGAMASALVGTGGEIAWIRVLVEGTGYATPPDVAIDPPSAGVTATAVAVIQRSATNAVASVTVSVPGNLYDIAPVITFSGGGGSGATAVAQIAGGDVKAIVMVNHGRDYVIAPGVVITPSGLGSGAVATAELEELSLTVVKEDVSQLPADDPRQSAFVLVTRVFETTPGPVLVDVKYDPKLRTTVRTEKRIVLSSTVPGAAGAFVPVNGQVTEFQSTPNKNRSIKIVSSIAAPPDSYTFYTSANYRMPDQIVENPAFAVAFAQAENDRIAQDVALQCNVINGYAGACKARIGRHFTFTPNEAFFDSLPTITPIYPQADSVFTAFTFADDTQAIANVRSFSIPQSLHPALTFALLPASLPQELTDGFSKSGLSATTPPVLASGTWIVVDINTSLDERFGLWIYDVLEIQIP